jgi:hypothetical protein
MAAVFSACGAEKPPQKDGAQSDNAGQYTAEKDFEVKTINNGKAVEIVRYKGAGKEVNIPPRIKNLPVTVIGPEAFKNKQLVGITIPLGVTSIGKAGFAENQLIEVTIPSSVTAVGGWAFAKNALVNVIIPSSVTSTDHY